MTANASTLRNATGSLDARQVELADRVARMTPGDGFHPTAFAPLTLIRASAPSHPLPVVYQPSLCLVVQGSKTAQLGTETYHYDPLHMLIVSVALPVRGCIVDATPDKPYLCLRMDIDAREVSELLLDMDADARPAARVDRGVFLSRVTEPLLDTVLRLVRLIEDGDDVGVLGPIALREVYYRVLRGEMGSRLRQVVESSSHGHRIAQAVTLLQQRFAQPLRIEALADELHMSASTLHHRFKALTSMSPLQFQKHLRLHEARRLMLAEGLEAASAGHRVGYESPSQFSREYRRLFGAPPRQEIDSVRRSGAMSAAV